MRPLPLKLDPGSDLRLSLEELGRTQQKNGFVLSIVGNLSQACFQCPGKNQPTTLKGNLEIISLNGTFNQSGVHLHLSLSDSDCQVWGGHLEPGTLIYKGAELLLALIEVPFTQQSPKTLRHPEMKSRIEIVILPDCPWSNKALKILNSLKIPYMVNTITNDSEFSNFQKRSDFSTFPQIFIDGQLLGGYDELTAFHKAGRLEEFR